MADQKTDIFSNKASWFGQWFFQFAKDSKTILASEAQLWVVCEVTDCLSAFPHFV